MSVGPELFVSLKQGSISNQYKIDKVLGEGNKIKFYLLKKGAFGCVRLVTHKSTGIQRAMK